jgi:hypothetical protein
MILYIFFIAFILYFLSSIVYKELYWIIVFPIYKYTGKGAIFLATLFIILFVFGGLMLVPEATLYSLKNLLISLLLGLPISFLIRIIFRYLPNTTITDEMAKRPRTKKSMIEWGLAGLFISMPFNFVLFIFLKYTQGTLTTITTVSLITIISVLFFSFWGSRTNFI